MPEEPQAASAEAEIELCRACDAPVRKGLSKCPRCDYPAYEVEPCLWCGEYIPKDAKRCAKCTSYKEEKRSPFPWQIVLQGVATIVSVLGLTLTAVLPLLYAHENRHSHTAMAFHSASKDVLYVSVVNSGLRPSTLRTYRLEFGGKPAIDDVELELADGSQIVPKESNVLITLKPRYGTLVTRILHGDLVDALDGKSVTLRIGVEESSDPRAGPWTQLAETVSAPRLEAFVIGNTPEVPEPLP
jgi:hypothetical protein